MNKISSKLILLLAVSALVPLGLYGIVAIWTARETAREIVVEENLQIAKRAAEQIEQYVSNSMMVLGALAQTLSKTDLKDWQRERIIKNYTLEFEQFESIDLFDESGRVLTSSRINASPPQPEALQEALQAILHGEFFRSKVFISENFVPSMLIGVPVKSLGQFRGGIVSQLNLIEMWKLVDGIRIGREGFALVASKDGLLIAHGESRAKERVLRQENIGENPVVHAALNGQADARVYNNEEGLEKIAVSAPVEDLGWALVIEQPTREAYAAAARLTRQLSILIAVFLVIMVFIGWAGGRHYVVAPIRELIRGIRSVGGENSSVKVNILTKDEFSELGDAFNSMTDRLALLEQNIRQNERAVLLGRIAGGLVHDLKHPIENIQNSSRMVLQSFDDPHVRQVYERVVQREFLNLNRFLENLLHLSRPRPTQPVWVALGPFLKELLESFETHPRCRLEGRKEPEDNSQASDKITISYRLTPLDVKVWADRFGLERVLTNLINNGLDSIQGGGSVHLDAASESREGGSPSKTTIKISDSGCGIPSDRIETLFIDFTTTKRKGIGLGLAICKKIMDDHNGTIEVQSTQGNGTTFILTFPPLSPSQAEFPSQA